ncbi:hypothetical protein [Ventosimonas gracilis]|uniref:hypothetical protein n=1 Tax=Ventosimonas gracilis TaxID=1680762 RepID=UPI001365F980|nr:hypothetical protein [Ventosimonas gracilis]
MGVLPSENNAGTALARDLYRRALRHLPDFEAADIRRAQKGIARCDKNARGWNNS